MPKTKQKRKSGTSNSGLNIFIRNEQKREAPVLPQIPINPASGNFRFPKLKKRTNLEIRYLTNDLEIDHEMEMSGDFDDNEVPDLLQSMYDGLKSMYRNNKKQLIEPKFSEETPWIHVLHWMLQSFHKICPKDCYWYVRKIGGEFSFIQAYYHDRYKGRLFVPLEFLPRLRKQGNKLHDIIFECIIMIKRNCNVETWSEGYSEFLLNDHMPEWIENSIDEHTEDDEVQDILYQYLLYTSGEPMEYDKEIQIRFLNKKSLSSRIYSFDPKSQREQELINWAKRSLDIPACNIMDYSFNPFDPNANSNEPLSIDRSIRFVWSNNDAVTEWISDSNHADEGEYGCITPCDYLIIDKETKEKSVVKTYMFKKICDHLISLNNIVYRHYKPKKNG